MLNTNPILPKAVEALIFIPKIFIGISIGSFENKAKPINKINNGNAIIDMIQT
jgi:hypothetical protein